MNPIVLIAAVVVAFCVAFTMSFLVARWLRPSETAAPLYSEDDDGVQPWDVPTWHTSTSGHGTWTTYVQ